MCEPWRAPRVPSHGAPRPRAGALVTWPALLAAAALPRTRLRGARSAELVERLRRSQGAEAWKLLPEL